MEVRGDIWSGVFFHFRAWRRTLWSFLAGCISGAVWRAWAIEEVEFGRSESGKTISGFLTTTSNNLHLINAHILTGFLWPTLQSFFGQIVEEIALRVLPSGPINQICDPI